MERTIGKPKLICKVDKSIFASGNGTRPTYYYGGPDGHVYAIYSKRENPNNKKSKFKFSILHLEFDFSYDYENEIVLKKVKADLKPISNPDKKLENYHKRLVVIRMYHDIKTRKEPEGQLNKYFNL
jgi:hypothetical protein